MTPAELLALAQRLLYGCRDPVTGERLYAGLPAEAIVEDVEEAARYLRACAEAAAAPRVSTRQPLTDDEIKRLAGTPAAIPGTFIHAVVRAVERHHHIESESK